MDVLLSSCETPPYKSFGVLERGDYPIRKFSVVETKYGNRVRLDLTEFHVYLPARFQAADFPKERIDELNRKDVILEFKGKEPGVNGRYVCFVVKNINCNKIIKNYSFLTL